jgi:formate/nitrite transporter FocA (FNT family)
VIVSCNATAQRDKIVSDGQQGLSQDEKRDAKRRAAPSATVVFEAIRREAKAELQRPNDALFWSALAAGLSMGFSFIAEAMLRKGLPEAEWTYLISKLGYSVGFLIVILGRQQLFTENTLTPVLELLRERSSRVFAQTLRLWSVVMLGNLVGTFLFALLLFGTAMLDSHPASIFESIAAHTVAGGFWTTFVQAIFAGWLIALTIWLLPFAETARVGVIIILTYLIGIGGFPHIIAGSTEAFFAVMSGVVSTGDAVGRFFVPTLLGNIVGGVALVAALNFGQVTTR